MVESEIGDQQDPTEFIFSLESERVELINVRRKKREPNFGPVGVWPHGHYGGNTNLHAHLIPSSEEEWTEMRTKFRKSSFSLQPGSTISFGDIGLLYKNGAIEVNPCRDAVSTISYFNYRHGVGGFARNEREESRG